MNMASMGILLIFTIIYISIENANTAFVQLECKAEKLGQYGQQSLLECVVKTTQADIEIRVVTWKKDGVEDPFLVFHKGDFGPQRGCSFAEPSWNVKNMNVSLLIANTAVEHEGVYTCMVLTDSGRASNSTSLKVTANYNKPTIHSNPEGLTLNTDGTLICDTDEGYPKGQLRWFDENNQDLTERAPTEAKLTTSGLFQLSSKLTLQKGSTLSKYTCTVFNASGGKEEEDTFQVLDAPTAGGQGQRPEKELDTASKIVAPVVVIGSLIVGLLMALLFYRRRSRQDRRPSTAPLMGDHPRDSTCEADDLDGDPQENTQMCQDSPA